MRLIIFFKISIQASRETDLKEYFVFIHHMFIHHKCINTSVGNNCLLFCWFLSGFWTFLYFVSFCFLASQWSRTQTGDLPLNQGADAARAAIAFSFFSIITWVRIQNHTNMHIQVK